jgi:biotin synthase
MSMPERHDWTREEVLALYELPLTELVFRAAEVHRRHHDPRTIQLSTLLSIKTGACPEDCAYCPLSAHYDTGVEVQKLLPLEIVLELAEAARARGATRFCMGAAWRSPRDRDLARVAEMVRAVKALGLETCCTLGMLRPEQARALKDAGLDYYNHNLDTAPEYYAQIISTRGFQDRLDTLAAVREAGIKVCCGGIVGMNEDRSVRAGLLQALANLPAHPESVPINALVRIPGTPLETAAALDEFEFVRTIAVARLLMPRSMVRLSAGREALSDGTQALCFLAGANSIFYGERLLTAANPEAERDQRLLQRLGLEVQPAESAAHPTHGPHEARCGASALD